jgi:twitching motility protein PilT
VFATLHTQDTSQTVDRIVDSFPPSQQHQVRTQLSIALQGIVTQQLLPTADGQGRACACEVLVPTPAVRNLIREGKTHQLYSALQTGGSHGMQTMDSSLADLARGGVITRQLAESRSSTPEELKRLLEGSAPAGASEMTLDSSRLSVGDPGKISLGGPPNPNRRR